jgi:hypothetical protein
VSLSNKIYCGSAVLIKSFVGGGGGGEEVKGTATIDAVSETPTFGIFLTETQKHEIKRRYNHGDHNGTRKSDGGDDSAENVAAMCSFCHWVKTVIFDDGKKGSIKGTEPK